MSPVLPPLNSSGQSHQVGEIAAPASPRDKFVLPASLENERAVIHSALGLMQQAEPRLFEICRNYSDRILNGSSPSDDDIVQTRDGLLQEFAQLEQQLDQISRRAEWMSSQLLHLRAALGNGRASLAEIRQPGHERLEAAWRIAVEPQLQQTSRTLAQSVREGLAAARLGREIAAPLRVSDGMLYADLHSWAMEGSEDEARAEASLRILAAREQAGFVSLDLRNLGLTSLPRMTFNVRDLAYLDLSNNPLPELPPDLGNLLELRTLVCEGPHFSQVPDAVWNLHPDCLVYFDQLDPQAEDDACARAERQGGPRLVFHPEPTAPSWPADAPLPQAD